MEHNAYDLPSSRQPAFRGSAPANVTNMRGKIKWPKYDPRSRHVLGTSAAVRQTLFAANRSEIHDRQGYQAVVIPLSPVSYGKGHLGKHERPGGRIKRNHAVLRGGRERISPLRGQSGSLSDGKLAESGTGSRMTPVPDHRRPGTASAIYTTRTDGQEKMSRAERQRSAIRRRCGKPSCQNGRGVALRGVVSHSIYGSARLSKHMKHSQRPKPGNLFVSAQAYLAKYGCMAGLLGRSDRAGELACWE